MGVHTWGYCADRQRNNIKLTFHLKIVILRVHISTKSDRSGLACRFNQIGTAVQKSTEEKRFIKTFQILAELHFALLHPERCNPFDKVII